MNSCYVVLYNSLGCEMDRVEVDSKSSIAESIVRLCAGWILDVGDSIVVERVED